MQNSSPDEKPGNQNRTSRIDVNQSGGVNFGAGNYVGQTGDIHSTVYHYNYVGVNRSPSIRTISPPALPDPYINRPDLEKRLEEELRQQDGSPLTLVYGLSGGGKSTLVAQVARNLYEENVYSHLLWGSLDGRAPGDLLYSLLSRFDPEWWQSAPPPGQLLRDLFWSIVASNEGRTLVVFDHVRDAQQLVELLPSDPGMAGVYRIVAISIHRLNLPGWDGKTHPVEVRAMKAEQAQQLLAGILGLERYELYAHTLDTIAQRLEYVPQLLIMAARDMQSGATSPAWYEQMLQRQEGKERLLSGISARGLEFVVRDLTPDQRFLLSLIGVPGEGDWSDAMLASIAFRRLEDMRRDLEVLAARGMIQKVGQERYRANMLVRYFAQALLRQQPAYVEQAAAALLAHYCLDLVHEHVAALQESHAEERRAASESDASRLARQLQRWIEPELPHIRAALQYAAHEEQWDLLLHFGRAPHLNVLERLVVAGYEIRAVFTLTTLIEPVIWRRGKARCLRYEVFTGNADWSISPPLEGGAPASTLPPGGVNVIDDNDPAGVQKCELSLDLAAGRIVAGTFVGMSLIDSVWRGVEAPGLILNDVDIVGARFLACDLRNSVLVDCDARHITMLGTNASFTLLKGGRYNGAQLRGINLSGAVIEGADLRGADLRGARLVQARLRNADLRDATLEGADLRGAELRDVKLNGCNLHNVRWAGAHIELKTLATDSPAILKDIERSRSRADDAEPELRLKSRPATLDGDKVWTLAHYDLRAFQLQHAPLTHVDLHGADLRTADLHHARLIQADLHDAQARGADFSSAELTGAMLQHADLRAAMFTDVQAQGINAEGALFRGAWMQRTRLQRARFASASLRGADLQDADLEQAVLDGADLAYAILVSAHLEGASLRGANLQFTDLRGARLKDAVFDDADLQFADLRGTCITPEQLVATRRFSGARLNDETAVLLWVGRQGWAGPEYRTLRFAHLDGEHFFLAPATEDLFGARLDGVFIRVDMREKDLSYARLSGIFAGGTLAHARLHGSRLSGVFHGVDLSGAILTEANVSDASFVDCNLAGATIDERQLRRAARLRGTTLPDGKRYDGTYDLSGDLEDARRAGIDPADREALRRLLYDAKVVKFKTL